MNSTKHQRSILVGLIGSGIGSSLSPAMHEREGFKQGMTYIYRSIDLDKLQLSTADLPELLLAADRLGFTGLNITHPCKQLVIEYLDDLSEAAARIGAVNTVVFSNGRRVGHNTDAWGFLESFREEIAESRAHEKILLLGAGGAGAAIAHSLLSEFECFLEITDIDHDRAESVVGTLKSVYGNNRVRICDNVSETIASADGVINATPVGMTLHPGCPLDIQLLRPELWVADIIYFPLDTELVTAAAAEGCAVMKGGGMAVYQAVRSFERFTGVRPDVARMKAHFNSFFEARESGAAHVRKLPI